MGHVVVQGGVELVLGSLSESGLTEPGIGLFAVQQTTVNVNPAELVDEDRQPANG